MHFRRLSPLHPKLLLSRHHQRKQSVIWRGTDLRHARSRNHRRQRHRKPSGGSSSSLTITQDTTVSS